MVFPVVIAESCNDIADEIRSVNSPAFDRYEELNDIKQDILLIIYSMDRAQCDAEKIGLAGISRDYILDFDRAFMESISNSTPARLQALNTSLILKNYISELDNLNDSGQKSEERDLINSARVVYTNFLLDQAEVFSSDALNSTETREKIVLLYGASMAYSRSGESLDSLNMGTKAQLLEGRYLEDRNEAEGHISILKSSYDNAWTSREKGSIGKIEAYVLAREASINGREALEIYSYHGEKDKIDDINSQLSAVEELKNSLLMNILVIFFGLFIVLSSFTVYFLYRIKQWIFDTRDMTLGNDIIKVENLED